MDIDTGIDITLNLQILFVQLGSFFITGLMSRSTPAPPTRTFLGCRPGAIGHVFRIRTRNRTGLIIPLRSPSLPGSIPNVPRLFFVLCVSILFIIGNVFIFFFCIPLGLQRYIFITDFVFIILFDMPSITRNIFFNTSAFFSTGIIFYIRYIGVLFITGAFFSRIFRCSSRLSGLIFIIGIVFDRLSYRSIRTNALLGRSIFITGIFSGSVLRLLFFGGRVSVLSAALPRGLGVRGCLMSPGGCFLPGSGGCRPRCHRGRFFRGAPSPVGTPRRGPAAVGRGRRRSGLLFPLRMRILGVLFGPVFLFILIGSSFSHDRSTSFRIPTAGSIGLCTLRSFFRFCIHPKTTAAPQSNQKRPA